MSHRAGSLVAGPCIAALVSAVMASQAFAQTPLATIELTGSAASFTPPEEGPDETPVAYSFDAQTDVEPGSVAVATPAVTVAGLGVAVTAVASGDGSPGFRIDGGGLQTSAEVQNGDALELSLETAAGAFSTPYTATLQVGTYSANFTVTTRPPVTVSLAAPAETISALEGDPFTFDFSSLATASGGPSFDPAEVSDLAWSIGDGADPLPAWLTLDAGSGLVSGTPSEEGSSSFEVVAAYLDGEGRRIYVIDVAGVPIEIVKIATSHHAGSSNPFDMDISHTCALDADGQVWCWGDNQFGQLGIGNFTGSPVPVLVTGLPAAAVDITTGFAHTCAVTTAGAAWCWGRALPGSYGVGDGTTTTRNAPVEVMASGAQSISAGSIHTCAVTTSGGAMCWGNGGSGRLGNGLTTNALSPVSVSVLTAGIEKITSGFNHSCALTSTGAAYCWGSNSNGKIGDGTTTNRTSPVPVSGLGSNVQDLAAGGNHTCAVVSGAAQCWGSNANGQLGKGDTASVTTAGAVTGLTTGVLKISAGRSHSCAVETGGALSCWGENASGELGDGSTTQATVPVEILASGIQDVDAGVRYTCGLREDGDMFCWGRNAFGGLGDGTTTNRSAPTAVAFP
jgi:alpha-tubulin suppressor-like RCC1 family protein